MMIQMPIDALTERETEVLDLIAEGLSNKEIAKALYLSPHTIAWYIQQIFSKLGVHKRTQAVALFREQETTVPSADSQMLTKSPTNLKTQSTSFIGRTTEIDAIKHLLLDDGCHLVSIVGIGGIGKSRLAHRVAEQLIDHFADGVFYIELQPLTSSEQIVPTIASQLGLPVGSTPQNTLNSLIKHCHDKALLLVVDNFEHLIDGIDFIPTLLAQVSSLRMIIASREALNLYEEYIYLLDGLAYPNDPISLDSPITDAMSLFIDRAKQVYSDFCLEKEFTDIIRICNLVEGIPLALELGACWLKIMTCKEIADEIEQGLGILQTRFKNIPARHRSMLTVFDYSWELLTEKEQHLFQRLSVFRGGCSQDAAQSVAGATRSTLEGLIDKSCIQRDPLSGRYIIHELLRQYGEAKLRVDTTVFEITKCAHSQYFMTLLANYDVSIGSAYQLEMIEALEPDLDNIRIGWTYAVSRRDIRRLMPALNTFAYFHVFRSRFAEEAQVLEQTINTLSGLSDDAQNSQFLAAACSYCGWVYLRISHYDKATTFFETSYQIYEQYSVPIPSGWGSDPRTGLSLLASIQGEYDIAAQFGQDALCNSRAQNDLWNLQLALYCLTSTSFHQGLYDEAKAYSEEALAISQQMGDIWFRAIILNDLGNIARIIGQYSDAKVYYQESLEIRERFSDKQGVAAALMCLGKIAALEGNYEVAQTHYYQSYMGYKDVQDKGGIGYALSGLGATAYAQGDTAKAGDYFWQALEIASDIPYVPLMFSLLLDICQFLVDLENPRYGLAILAITRHHPNSDSESRSRSDTLRQSLETRLRSQIGDAHYSELWHYYQFIDPEQIIFEIILTLEQQIKHDLLPVS